MTDAKLDELIGETRKLNRLMSLSLTKGLSASDRIIFLDQAGFNSKEIAETFGVTTNVVNVTLFNDRKKKGLKRKKK